LLGIRGAGRPRSERRVDRPNQPIRGFPRVSALPWRRVAGPAA
jgi:hypothetical protein